LAIINRINAKQTSLPPLSAGQVPQEFLDVTGDNHVSPADALMVINAINARQTKLEPSTLALTKVFRDEIGVEVINPTTTPCGGSDPDDVGAALIVSGAVEGVVTNAFASVTAAREEVELYDGSSTRQAWGNTKVATATFTLEGWGAATFHLQAGVGGFLQHTGCGANTGWREEGDEVGLIEMDVTAYGTFSIFITVNIYADVLGTNEGGQIHREIHHGQSPIDYVVASAVHNANIGVDVRADYPTTFKSQPTRRPTSQTARRFLRPKATVLPN
jgi:hypothetical protein